MRGAEDHDEPIKALAAMGASAEQIAEARSALDARKGDALCEVYPGNWLAVRAFLALATQWRQAPFGGRVGLDYTAIMPTLRLMSVPRKEWPDVFDRLRVLEEESLEAAR